MTNYLRSRVLMGRAALAIFIAAFGGYALGYHAGATDPIAVPVCQEDEVVLTDGRCYPLDDAEYVGGEGWLSEPQYMWRIDTAGDG